jgi:hypothetical protein
MGASTTAARPVEKVRAENLEIPDRDTVQNGSDRSFELAPVDVHSEISKLAYSLWCQRGCPDGSPGRGLVSR